MCFFSPFLCSKKNHTVLRFIFLVCFLKAVELTGTRGFCGTFSPPSVGILCFCKLLFWGADVDGDDEESSRMVVNSSVTKPSWAWAMEPRVLPETRPPCGAHAAEAPQHQTKHWHITFAQYLQKSARCYCNCGPQPTSLYMQPARIPKHAKPKHIAERTSAPTSAEERRK